MKRVAKLPFLAGGFALLVGCAEHGTLVSPGMQPRVELAPDGYEVLSYNSRDEIPPEWLLAEVRNEAATTSWEGTVSKSWARHDFFANRGTQAFDLTIIKDGETKAHQTPTIPPKASAYPAWRTMQTEYPFDTGVGCGQIANLHVAFTAASYFLINSSFTTVGEAPASAARSATQPAFRTTSGGSPGGGGGDGGYCFYYAEYDVETGEITYFRILECMT